MLVQIFVFIGILESFSYEKVFYSPDTAPGNLGFDPLRMSKNPASAKRYSVSSVCRAASFPVLLLAQWLEVICALEQSELVHGLWRASADMPCVPQQCDGR